MPHPRAPHQAELHAPCGKGRRRGYSCPIHRWYPWVLVNVKAAISNAIELTGLPDNVLKSVEDMLPLPQHNFRSK